MIKLASLIYLDAVYELEKQFGAEAFSKRSLRHFILTSQLYVFVDNDDNVIGSAIILKRKNSNRCRLYSFIIDDRFRGKGVGKNYLHVLLEQLTYKEITLEVSENNKPAIGLYTLLGFEVTGTKSEYYKNKDNALVMKKVLDKFQK